MGLYIDGQGGPRA